MKFELKDWISLCVFVATIGIMWGNNAAATSNLTNEIIELKADVSVLQSQRDGLIQVQTQQQEIVKRQDKLDEKQEKILTLIYALAKP